MAITYATPNSYKKKDNTSTGTTSNKNTASGTTTTTTTTTPTSTGATYKVNADGKAPTGLSVGDNVVTSAGTYQITGVNADGTYKSSLVNNTTTNNYTGTYANAGGTTTGTATGATTGTATGTTTGTATPVLDTNVDYSKLMAEAAAKGDYKAAAQYEQLRNAKIAATNSSYAPTNQYAGWLDADYSAIGLQQMADGASWQDVLATYNNRYNKAITTNGLNQYASDDIQRQMWEYIQNAIAAEANPENYMDDFQYDEEKPTYDSQYDPAIQALVNQILNREDFSYDAENDPLYQQYASTYRREGDRAMRDTMAEAAASAGGMNSYAITAAQQANNNYMAQLNDKIPELYQLAYDMYLQDKESKIQDLGILQSLDATDYNRYRDTMSDYYADKNFAYNQYVDAVNRGEWEKNFAYNQAVNDRNYSYGLAQDTLDNQWKGREWNNAINQQTIENNRWDKEWAREEERHNSEIEREDALLARQEAQTLAYGLLDNGQMPSNELLEAAGISAADASAYVAAVRANMAAAKSSGGGSSGGSSKRSSSSSSSKATKPTLTAAQARDAIESGIINETTLAAWEYYYGEPWEPEDEDPDDPATEVPKPKLNDGSLEGLGLGPVTEDVFKEIAAHGGFVEGEDGGIYWADGWNAGNYREKINSSYYLPGCSPIQKI